MKKALRGSDHRHRLSVGNAFQKRSEIHDLGFPLKSAPYGSLKRVPEPDVFETHGSGYWNGKNSGRFRGLKQLSEKRKRFCAEYLVKRHAVRASRKVHLQ